MKREPRKWVIALAVILALFGLYNLIWYTVVWNKYGKLTEGMKELYYHRTYVIDELDGYTYNVKIPDYLSFTGNLGIQKSQDSDCALIIWPGIFKETEYGVFLEEENGRSYAVELTADAEPAAIGVTFDHVTAEEFCAAMNMMYSDYFPVGVKYGVDRPEFYADLAKAFLFDKDGPAPSEKLAEYYHKVVK